jgi:hypothetical protein
MTYAIELASCGMIYTPTFIKTGFGIQKLGEIHAHARTHTQHTHTR